MIPIFRAKHHRDNIYFIGSLIGKDDEYYIIEDEDMEYYRPIDPTTLAIHFPNMLDCQGNKIFASLSEDGKGGDICYVRDFSYGDLQGVARYEDNCFRIHRKGKAMGISLKCRDIKATGIQQ